MPLYAFTLGREWKLSLAELFSIFGEPHYHSHSEEIAVFHVEKTPEEMREIFASIGGSIRLIELISETDEKRFPTDVISEIRAHEKEGKMNFALGAYGLEYRLSDIGLRIKKTLSDEGVSARLVNRENSNIVSAVFKTEKLGKTWLEYNIIKMGELYHLGVTLACQDIDAYTRRDTGKSRDMAVGMMPPKLVDMMIHLANASDTKKCLYDPFSWLGTTLIEGLNMGYTSLMGSDISPDMVRASRSSVDTFVAEESIWHERIRKAWGTPRKDFRNLSIDIFELDASRILRHFEKRKLENTIIVSEGYLGEIMQKKDITLDRVKSERAKLMRIYDSFFHGLQNLDFDGTIVMTFPFWDIHGTYSYFTEIYDVIEDSGFTIVSLLPPRMELSTRKWSLLYKRPGQNVGREVIKIVRK